MGSRYTFKRLKGTREVQELSKAISEAKNFDIIINSLSKIMKKESITSFLESLLESGIIKSSDMVAWKE